MRSLFFLTLASASSIAWAEPPAAPPPPVAIVAPTEPVDPEPGAPSRKALDRRLRAMETENSQLREEVEVLRDAQEEIKQQGRRAAGRISGYLDVGFFAVQGNGTGIRSDLGNTRFPEYTGLVPDSWVFYGDPLATAVNARGEAASTGESRALTFDPIHNDGTPSFIVNALNLSLFSGITEHVSVLGLIDLVPRGRNVSQPNGLFLGDFLDVKLAYVEYLADTDWMQLSLYAGKIDGVLGIEYRSQESADRIGVTPSLICRYTCGRPVGLKARARFLGDALTAMLALTNGSHVTEMFPFYNEIDVNTSKTVAGRVSYLLPFANLELGASGLVGAQDNQPDSGVLHKHFGFDLHLDVSGFELNAEFVKGEIGDRVAVAPGMPVCANAPCLSYQGAYGLFGYRLNNWFMPYARVDFRDALHESGASFVYISDLLRATLGVHLELGTHTVVKAEYTIVRELGRLPQFPDDLFTSSLVVKF